MKHFTDDDLNKAKGMIEAYDPRLKLDALIARLEAAENLNHSEACPDCPDQGWYMTPSDSGPEQQQCQFCYENPKSKFNLENVWRRAAGK